MEILWFESLPSTQTYLTQKIRSKEIAKAVLVATKDQTDGIGSRGNRWDGEAGNLFFSFAFPKNTLPEDLPLSAASIYFSMLLKFTLEDMGSKVWVKWPNDFYIDASKVGGTITSIVSEFLICGIGLNLTMRSQRYKNFDISAKPEEILEKFILLLKKPPSWKMVLKKFELEFELSKKFYTHYNNERYALDKAQLCSDGALIIDDQRIYSLR